MEFRDIYLAQKRLGQLVRRTPLEHSPFFSKVCGGEIYLKLENLQLTGSFKIRGAFNKMLQLNKEEKIKGVVTASTGNHGQAVGYVARMLDIKATVVVPQNTPCLKINAIKRFGADLIIYGAVYDDAETKAKDLGRSRDMVYISPYNDYEIIAGQGTLALEMWEEENSLEVALIPVSGGGLISGVAIALKKINPEIEVIGAQPKASPVMYESLRRGKIVEIPMEDTVAEALHGGIERDAVTFEIVKNYVDEIMVVEEENIKTAISLFLEHQKQVVEGAGAVGLAALMKNKSRFRGRRVGIVVSGGNIEISRLKDILLEKDLSARKY